MRFGNPILRTIVKFLVVLLLPFSFEVFVSNAQYFRDAQYFRYNCFISIFLNAEQFYYLDSIELIMYQNMVLGSVILISIPLMYFEYSMRNMAPDVSAIPSAIILFSISVALFNSLISLQESIFTYYWNPYEIETPFTWAIFIFLVFPLLMRETKLLETHMLKDRPKPTKSRFKPSKYSILGYILCILVAIMPYSFITSHLENDFAETVLVSHSIVFSQWNRIYPTTNIILESGFGIYTHTYLRSFNLEITLLISIGFCVLLLRYFKCRSKKSTAILTGLFGASLPLIDSLMFQDSLFKIPTPFLLMTGFVLLKVIPVVKADEYIWDEIPVRFWYEPPKVIGKERMVFVKVPVRYILLSRLRILGSKNSSSRSKMNTKSATYDDI